MADSVATQTILNGSRKLVMKLVNVSDGTGESEVVKVDVSSYTPTITRVKISKIVFSTDGMAVQILWDATTPVLAYTLAKDQTGILDFRPFGGLHNNAGAGITGDIIFTTSGHTNGDSYSVILEMDKL